MSLKLVPLEFSFNLFVILIWKFLLFFSSGGNSGCKLAALSFFFLLFISTFYIEPFHLLPSPSVSGVKEEMKYISFKKLLHKTGNWDNSNYPVFLEY